jgi:uncharacterized protein YprB with RNaseH-like and TPR domain
MIERTFQQIPGVGPWREKDLWARGIVDWDAFDAARDGVVLSRKTDELARRKIAESRQALGEGNLCALAALFPPREHWRLYARFAQEAVFFDVEGDGATAVAPTVASLFDCDGIHVFWRNHNLDQLPRHLERRKFWVTFNGSCFDVPLLQSYFGKLPKPAVHVDLRFLFRNVRSNGGLKDLEQRMGIGRPPHLRRLKGLDAVVLWNACRRGDAAAFRWLVEYNLYDAFQLKSLMELGYNRKTELLNCDEPKLPVFDRGDLLYDVSKFLLQLPQFPSP